MTKLSIEFARYLDPALDCVWLVFHGDTQISQHNTYNEAASFIEKHELDAENQIGDPLYGHEDVCGDCGVGAGEHADDCPQLEWSPEREQQWSKNHGW